MGCALTCSTPGGRARSPSCCFTSSFAGAWASSTGRSSMRCGACRRGRAARTAGPAANPGLGACWAVIGDKYRLILFGRYPYYRAVAAGHRHAAVRRPLRHLGLAPLLAVGTGADLGRHAGRDRRADVGRRVWAELCSSRGMGWPANHADAGDLRAGAGVSARHPGGARPSRPGDAGGAPAVRALCRADPRGAADQPVVHGQCDVSAVHAGGPEPGQAGARAGGLHPVRRRLSGGGGARRVAGAARAASTRPPMRSGFPTGRRWGW